MGRGRGIAVVLGYPEAHQLTNEALGPIQQGGLTGSGNQLLELTGLTRIVIDADRVSDQ
ncbi:hypothetical protein D3C79_706370 [compost metagenome]